MASLESLPADQRAVLQLVLQRGRSYDDIARLLSIDPSAVRQRATSALNALGPQTGLVDERRQAITDYLLGQLDPAAATAAQDEIAAAPGERAWARVVASELVPLANGPLPEIPAAAPAPTAAPATAPLTPSPSPPPVMSPPVPRSAAGAEPAGEPPAAKPKRESILLRRARGNKASGGATGPPPETAVPDDADPGRSSLFGGMVLIVLTVVIVAAVVVILLNSGGSSPTHAALASSTTSTPATSSTATAPAGSATTTANSSSAAKVIAQINLTPPTATSKAAGIAEVLKEGVNNGIAIVAQNVTPNTTKPPNAYAVWLYNSATDAHILGFVNPGVAANGRLSTAGGLPTNAAHYKQLIVTLETKASPKTPGTIVLQGKLTLGP